MTTVKTISSPSPSSSLSSSLTTQQQRRKRQHRLLVGVFVFVASFYVGVETLVGNQRSRDISRQVRPEHTLRKDKNNFQRSVFDYHQEDGPCPPLNDDDTYNTTVTGPGSGKSHSHSHWYKSQITNYPTHHPLEDIVTVLYADEDPVLEAALRYGSDKNGVELSSYGSRNVDGKTRIICQYVKEGNFKHFPHTMQQFTRCFSFFAYMMGYRDVNLHDGIEIDDKGKHGNNYAVHVDDSLEAHIWRPRGDSYGIGVNGGLKDIFINIFGGALHGYGNTLDKSQSEAQQLRNKNLVEPDSIVVRPRYEAAVPVESPYQGITFQQSSHAEILRTKTAQYLNITMQGCRVGKDYPVINILNRQRQSTRTLSNAHAVREAVSEFTDHPVQIAYFEEADFHQQVEFMMQTDILISPHGAQLSTIFFMPSCGGVVEVFPPSYFVPNFFGPLAASSGLQHAYVYTGVDLETEWYRGGKILFGLRARSRKKDVCLPLGEEESVDDDEEETASPSALQVIGQLVERWKSCCREQLQSEPQSQ